MANVFGFSTEMSEGGGEFMPIVKYDARAGRIFRVDRIQTTNGFASEPVDITPIFKAVVDFENVETGWIDFPVGSAPSFVMVKMGNAIPDRPSLKHKTGIRLLLKLNKACGGDRPVRELAGTSRAFLQGVEGVYTQYQREAPKMQGQLPVLTLVSTVPIVSGTGVQKSTNYRPIFRIDGWAKRPDDLIHTAAPAAAPTNGAGIAPSTGSMTVPPPNTYAPLPETPPAAEFNRNPPWVADDDFG